MINVSLTSRETSGPPGWSRYLQKVNLALPFFEELQFELLSIASSLSLDPQKWSKENPPHATDILFWISSEDVSATEMIQSPGPHEARGQQVCLLRYKRICFSTRWGPQLDSLFLFTHGGRQLYQWNVSLNHRVLEHMKLECGNCYCLQ